MKVDDIYEHGFLVGYWKENCVKMLLSLENAVVHARDFKLIEEEDDRLFVDEERNYIIESTIDLSTTTQHGIKNTAGE